MALEPLRVVVIDSTQVGPGTMQLSVVWSVGSRLRGNFQGRIEVPRWDIAYDRLWELRRRRRIGHVQFWGHGSKGRPQIAGASPELKELARSCEMDEEDEWWWRGCEIFQGEVGQAFAVRACQIMKCKHIGHTRVISGDEDGDPLIGSILFQSGCYGLRPGETPHWSPDDHGGSGRRQPNTVRVWARNPPDFVWQPPAPR